MIPQYRWLLPEPVEEQALKAIGLSDELLARILYSRGIRTREEAERLLKPLTYEQEQSYSPFDIPGMYDAVAVLRWALSHDKRIVVYGDYDVDGLTATALLTESLSSLGARVEPFIPNRLDTGYGLDSGIITELAQSCDLIVTVDCGIRSPEEVALARSLGVQMVVTDHHLPGQEIPPANAVVSARLPGGEHLSQLAGVGVAHALSTALRAVCSRFGQDIGDGYDFLDLVALGTVADVAPLTGINRILVQRGLQSMSANPRTGLRALAEEARLNLSTLTSWDIAFGLAPRINAVGRLGSSAPALEILTTREPKRAQALARILERANTQRKSRTDQGLALAREELKDHPAGIPLIFTASDSYLPGVVGLMATRLAEERGSPAVAVAIEGELAHGSARSVEGFSISEALEHCREFLLKYGGHSQAGGFTCPTDCVDQVRERMQQFATAYLAGVDTRPTLKIDAESTLVTSTDRIWKHLPLLEPTGEGNPKPLLLTRNVEIIQRSTFGRDGAHLDLLATAGNHTSKIVAFRQGHLVTKLPQRLDIVYHLDENTFNGKTELRLLLQDMRSPQEIG